ncbi:MAG: DUF378 domain-containing protein [Oscillospiraceae bacterium]|nr:DUF378 domain-containing protein [Oscillospiraceae bacterium]
MYKFNILDKIAIIMAVFGAVNWGLYGLLGLDLIKLLFGQSDGGIADILARIVYILIGAAGVALIMLIAKMTQVSKFKLK